MKRGRWCLLLGYCSMLLAGPPPDYDTIDYPLLLPPGADIRVMSDMMDQWSGKVVAGIAIVLGAIMYRAFM